MPAPPVDRIRHRRVFAALRRPAGRAAAGPVHVRWVPSDRPVAQVAYAVGRHCGPAVVRNRVRRRLRAAVATAGAPPGCYLVGAGHEVLDLEFSRLQTVVREAMTTAARRGAPR